jgi:hypothetical protein
MKVIREIDHEPRTVREVRVFVRQYIWADGASSYDVHLADNLTRDEEGQPTDLLTQDNSFDHMPTDQDIERLPYLAPSVRREAPGVYYILTGPYQLGPYPSRKDANADIRSGSW